jgi:L,D-transpeptidase ErfK/SrfK
VSIQEEMRKAGKPVLTHVPPSPENPLGKYWIGLSIPGLGIHGTNTPSSIYRLATHGCIRLHPDDVKQLFPQVEIGTPGAILYQPVLMTRVEESVFLEAHPDVYEKSSDALATVMELARAAGYADLVDWDAARDVLRKREGVARDVTSVEN